MTSPLPQVNLSPEPQPQAQPVPAPAVVAEDPQIIQCRGVVDARGKLISKLLKEMQEHIQGRNAMPEETIAEINKLAGEAHSKAMETARMQAQAELAVKKQLPYDAFKLAAEQLAKTLPVMSVEFNGETYGPSQIIDCIKRIEQANSQAR